MIIYYINCVSWAHRITADDDITVHIWMFKSLNLYWATEVGMSTQAMDAGIL